jgi:hypothetical protein
MSFGEKKSDIFIHLLRREAKRQDDGGQAASKLAIGNCFKPLAK